MLPPDGGVEEGIRKLLIVEDDGDWQARLRDIAQAWKPGIQIATAWSLGQARSLTRREGPFDAAVTDLGLVDGDGRELVRELNPGGRWQRIIPIAVFSRKIGRPEADKELEQLPVSVIVKKPRDLTGFDERIFLGLLDRLEVVVRSAGLEERMAPWLRGLVAPEELEGWIHRGHEALLGSRPVAVLFDPGLVPGEDDADRERFLIELEGQMRSVFALPEEVRFRIGLRSAKADWEGDFQIIEVVRHPEGKPGPLPIGALPLVVTEALASPHSLFYTDPLFYAHLTGLTLPEALADLTDLFA